MSGLVLNTQARFGAGYTPMTPAAASTPSGATISQKAYGINGAGNGGGPTTAAYGSLGFGIAAIAVLIYLWWSLPK